MHRDSFGLANHSSAIEFQVASVASSRCTKHAILHSLALHDARQTLFRTHHCKPKVIPMLSGTHRRSFEHNNTIWHPVASNPLKVLIKENKVIYRKYKSAKFGLVSYCH